MYLFYCIWGTVSKFWGNKIFTSIIVFPRYLVMWKTSWPFLSRWWFTTDLYCSGQRNTQLWQLDGIWSWKQCKWIYSLLQWYKKDKRMKIGWHLIMKTIWMNLQKQIKRSLYSSRQSLKSVLQIVKLLCPLLLMCWWIKQTVFLN